MIKKQLRLSPEVISMHGGNVIRDIIGGHKLKVEHKGVVVPYALCVNK